MTNQQTKLTATDFVLFDYLKSRGEISTSLENLTTILNKNKYIAGCKISKDGIKHRLAKLANAGLIIKKAVRTQGRRGGSHLHIIAKI